MRNHHEEAKRPEKVRCGKSHPRPTYLENMKSDDMQMALKIRKSDRNAAARAPSTQRASARKTCAASGLFYMLIRPERRGHVP